MGFCVVKMVHVSSPCLKLHCHSNPNIIIAISPKQYRKILPDSTFLASVYLTMLKEYPRAALSYPWWHDDYSSHQNLVFLTQAYFVRPDK
jgi:hypothetical protein